LKTLIRRARCLKPLKPLLCKNSLRSLLTLGERYLQGRGFEKPCQEAEALLLTLLLLTRIDLYIDSNREISDEDKDAFFNRVIRRGEHEPLQYITGEIDFCGLTLSVSPGVFIPRPETELIVEEASRILPTPQSILDICTGSGALAIALAKQFPLASITAIDCSQIALDTARRNANRLLGSPKITFMEGDLFSPFFQRPRRAFCPNEVSITRSPYDLIVCNPPYIAKEDTQTMDTEVLFFEPPLALFSEDSGLAHIKRVLTQAPLFLSPCGILMLEIGIGQSDRLIDFIKKSTPFTVRVIQDFAGIDRILICQWTK